MMELLESVKGDSFDINDEEKIYKRWAAIGLLEGLDEKVARECALCFQKMAQYCLYESTQKNGKYGIFEMCVFPMIRRVLQDVGSFDGKFSPKEFEDFWYDNYNDMFKKAEELAKEKYIDMKNVDFDAEICARMSDEFAKRFKK